MPGFTHGDAKLCDIERHVRPKPAQSPSQYHVLSEPLLRVHSAILNESISYIQGQKEASGSGTAVTTVVNSSPCHGSCAG